MLTVVDAHTEGQPMRIVTSGFPVIRGSTMQEKCNYVERELGELWRRILYEPRGHNAMCGAFLVEPTIPEADVGVVFIEPIGVVPMCGHGSIAIAKVLVETQRVEVREPTTSVKLDTLAGLVDVKVRVRNGEVEDITLRNVESFSYLRGVEVQTEKFGNVTVDIAYGGTFYAIVPAEDLGLEIVPKEASRIIEYGEIIRSSIQEQVKIRHPKESGLEKVLYIQFTAPPVNPRAHMRNVVVVAPSGVDRSPCGTGTSARMADLAAKGKLQVGEEFVHESIIGTLFRGKIIGESQVGEYPAVNTEISGMAYITGFQNLVFEQGDPFTKGFLLT
jgi:proline racemase